MKSDIPETSVAKKPVKRRVRLDPHVRRRQIVAQATRLIAHSGFNAVSLADIANACDVRKSTILHYFPSMKALLTAVLEDRDPRDFSPAAPRAGAWNTAKQARKAVTEKFEDNLRHREIILMFHVLAAESLSPEHPAHDYFRARAARARTGLLQILAWKADPNAAALELLAFWQGLEVLWLTDPQIDVLPVWRIFADRFFSG